jgi:hypothetical protein
MTENSYFSWKKFGAVMALSLLVGVGEYAVAWQFNDGNITQRVIGAVFLGMALPSLLFGGVMRIFKPELQRYFAICAGIFLLIGLVLILT